MGNIDRTWQEVQVIVDIARGGIVQAVKEMLARVDNGKAQELNLICAELRCKMWVILDEDGSNPFLIRPMMYVWFEETDERLRMQLWQSLLKRIEWASTLRITMKLIEKPYEGEALYAYPHT